MNVALRNAKSGALVWLLAASPVLAATTALVAGCREMPSEDPPVLVNPNMYDQERYNPESYSEFFNDHRTMRQPVEGTLQASRRDQPGHAHTPVAEDPIGEYEMNTGLAADGSGYVLFIPDYALEAAMEVAAKFAPTPQAKATPPKGKMPGQDERGGRLELLDRGQERYGIYCAPCHGLRGDGKGMVAKAGGFPPIPTYHDDRIRHMPDGQLFNTITHGVRTMPSYAAQIPVADRWAIVEYVRALEFSQLDQGEPKK